MAALACKEDEWNARERQFKLPAGRPRLLAPDGSERLLDDGITDALPVWSPDASKIATAFDTDVAIYDAKGKTPTQARLPLGDQLIAASVAYEEKTTTKKAHECKLTGARVHTGRRAAIVQSDREARLALARNTLPPDRVCSSDAKRHHQYFSTLAHAQHQRASRDTQVK